MSKRTGKGRAPWTLSQPLGPKFALISAEIVLVLIVLFFIANGEGFLGDYYNPGALLFYLVMVIVGPLFFSPKGQSMARTDQALKALVIAVPIFFITVLIMRLFVPTPTLGTDPSIGAVLFIAFIAPGCEEVIFRKYLPVKFGIFISAGLFAFFHWAAYGASTVGIIFMFFFGLLASGLFIIAGLGAAWAFHTGYNGRLIGAW
jgi:membrane protease YdiL (CAAX protease family)